MTDSIPAFRRWAGAPSRVWARFSYKESLVAQGAAWTLGAWLISGILATLLFVLEGSLGEGGDGGRAADNSISSLLVVFPGTPLIGFITGAALSGRAAGFWHGMKRGLKASAFLFLAVQFLAVFFLIFGGEKAGLAAAILFWIGVSGSLAGLTGGALRRLGEKVLPAPKPKPAPEAAQVQVPAGSPWLDAVAAGLREAGLCDYATATAFHRQLQNTGQAAPGTKAPFEEKYDAVFAKLSADFPGKGRGDWLAANETLHSAALIAAKAFSKSPARVRPALEAAFPGMSGAFYEWAAESARRLP